MLDDLQQKQNSTASLCWQKDVCQGKALNWCSHFPEPLWLIRTPTETKCQRYDRMSQKFLALNAITPNACMYLWLTLLCTSVRLCSSAECFHSIHQSTGWQPHRFPFLSATLLWCNWVLSLNPSINQLAGDPTVFPSSVKLCCGAIECFHSTNQLAVNPTFVPFHLPLVSLHASLEVQNTLVAGPFWCWLLL